MICLGLSVRAYGTQTPSLLTFPSFPSDGIWWIVTCLASPLIPEYYGGLHCTNAFRSSSKSDERPGLGSSFNDVSPERNFTNQFRTVRLVKVPSPYTHIFSAVSVRLSPCLNSHNITWRICTSTLPFHSLQIYYFNEMLKLSLLW